MTRVLLDTHAWAWSLTAQHRLSAAAVSAIDSADTVCLSAISFYEIGQKVRIGKWPEMASQVLGLPDMARRQGLQIIFLETYPCRRRCIHGHIVILLTELSCQQPGHLISN